MTENGVNPSINNDPMEKRNEFIDHPSYAHRMFCINNVSYRIVQINEIQENIDEITCIFQKVLFSLVKHIKNVFH